MATFNININAEVIDANNIVGETVVTGDLVFLSGDGKYYRASATTIAKSSTELRLALEDGVDGDTISMLTYGYHTFDSLALIPGSKLYVSVDPGKMTTQLYSNFDYNVRYVGTAYDSTTLLFNPDQTYISESGSKINGVPIAASNGLVDINEGVNVIIDKTNPLIPIINVPNMSYDDSLLDARITQNESDIANVELDLVGLHSQVDANELVLDQAVLDIASNAGDIVINRADIDSNDVDIADLYATKVTSVVAGSGILVNGGDPLNPVVSALPLTTAGFLNRIYFTGDEVITTEGTFYTVSPDKGTVANIQQTITVNDFVTDFFAQDLLGEVQIADVNNAAGTYAGLLTVESSSSQEPVRFDVEVYLADADGVPINSGVTGAAIGTLGVTTVVMATTGDVTMSADNVQTEIISTLLPEPFVIPANHRIRWRVLGTKRGTIGGSFSLSVYYGYDHNTYIDLPIPIDTDTVLNSSLLIPGVNTTDALDWLYNNKADSADLNGYLPLTAGAGFPLTDNLYLDGTREVISTGQLTISSGQANLYLKAWGSNKIKFDGSSATFYKPLYAGSGAIDVGRDSTKFRHGYFSGNVIGQTSPTLGEHLVNKDYSDTKLQWANEWVQATYEANTMVRDGDWLMVSNTQTSERAAPQLASVLDWDYQGTVNTTTATVKQLITGNRYTFDTDTVITAYRVNLVAGNTYTIYSVRSPGTANEYRQVISNFLSQETGWKEVGLDDLIVTAGTVYDFMLVIQEPDPTEIYNDYDYDYVTTVNLTVPLAGQMTHSNKNLGTIYVHKTDSNANDNSIYLESLVITDRISIGSIQWSIQAVIDQGTYMEYIVSPELQYTTGGVSTFRFTTTASDPITYAYETDYWLGNASRQGFYVEDAPYESAVYNDNFYGVDLKVSELSKSDDWDFATSVSGGGITESGSAIEIVDDLVTQDPFKALSANQGYVLSQQIGTDISAALTDYLPLAGGTMTGDILPDADGTLNIGSDPLRFNSMYSDHTITGELQLPAGGKIIGGSAGDSFQLSTEIKVFRNMIPSSDNLRTIGSDTFRWKSGHFAGNVSGADATLDTHLVTKGQMDIANGAYLPLAAGASNPLTGKLYTKEIVAVSDAFPVTHQTRETTAGASGSFSSATGIGSGIYSYTRSTSTLEANLPDGFGGGFLFGIGGSDSSPDTYDSTDIIARIYARKDTGTGGSLQFWTGQASAGANIAMTLRGTGNLGIGEVTPTERLHVAGNGKFTGTVEGADATLSTHFITKAQFDAADGWKVSGTTNVTTPIISGDVNFVGAVDVQGSLEANSYSIGSDIFLSTSGANQILSIKDSVNTTQFSVDTQSHAYSLNPFSVGKTTLGTEVLSVNGNVLVEGISPSYKFTDIGGTETALIEMIGNGTLNINAETGSVAIYNSNGPSFVFGTSSTTTYRTIVPSTTDIRDLGSTSSKFKNAYFSGTVQGADGVATNEFVTKGQLDSVGSGPTEVLNNYQEIASTVVGSNIVATLPIATYDGAFFDYVIKNGTSLQAGRVIAIHDGTLVSYSISQTQDLGDCDDIVLSVDISGTDLRLMAEAASTGWTIKTSVKAI